MEVGKKQYTSLLVKWFLAVNVKYKNIDEVNMNNAIAFKITGI